MLVICPNLLYWSSIAPESKAGLNWAKAAWVFPPLNPPVADAFWSIALSPCPTNDWKPGDSSIRSIASLWASSPPKPIRACCWNKESSPALTYGDSNCL